MCNDQNTDAAIRKERIKTMARYCPYLDQNTVYLTCKECERPICRAETVFYLIIGANLFPNMEAFRKTLDQTLKKRSSVVIAADGEEESWRLAERYAEETNLPFLLLPANEGKTKWQHADAMYRFIAKQPQGEIIVFRDGKSENAQRHLHLADKYGIQIRIVRMDETINPIGQRVHVVVDRPLGSRHPDYPNLVYPVNYGYVPHVMAEDGEEQDAYVIDVEEPIADCIGTVIAVIRRADDVESKWVVAVKETFYSDEQILNKTHFQEQFYTSWVER